MLKTVTQSLVHNFLGGSPRWYKLAIVAFLVVNPIVFLAVSPFVGGWLLVAEFIFTLAMALKCYPLQPGGLLAIEAIAIGMASPDAVFEETHGELHRDPAADVHGRGHLLHARAAAPALHEAVGRDPFEAPALA